VKAQKSPSDMLMMQTDAEIPPAPIISRSSSNYYYYYYHHLFIFIYEFNILKQKWNEK